MQDLVFDAQSALLLDEPGSAVRLVAARPGAAARPLARGLKRRGARTPTARPGPRWPTPSAAPRAPATRPRSPRRAGACAAALFRAATPSRWRRSAAGDARRAPRPGCCCGSSARPPASRGRAWTRTLAVRELARGRSAPARGPARREEGPARRLPGQPRPTSSARPTDAAERGFDARWAQTAALAAGLWRILAPEYEKTRGAAAARSRRTPPSRALAGTRPARRRRRLRGAPASDVARALDGFTAAPFTAEEQARRAGQLIRFVELIPVDYDHGTEDGKVTIPFELQESIAFSEAAISAFSDLEEELKQRDPRATAAGRRARSSGSRATSRTPRTASGVASQDTMESTQERASDTIEDLLPDEWKQDDAQSDFDLIAISLDRMEAAVGAGQYAAGGAVAPRGLRVLRVRARAEPALDRARRGQPGRGPDLVRRRRPRGPGQADRATSSRAATCTRLGSRSTTRSRTAPARSARAPPRRPR